MSTVKANSYYDTNGGTNAMVYGVATPPNSMGFRNRIINGDMRIDQRNAGASVTPTATAYTLDRWQSAITQSSKFSVQQNAGAITAPAGFTNYLGATSLSAYALLTSDYFVQRQIIEGLNCSDLAWGSSDAQPVTLSFRVRSSVTGTFGGSIRNEAGNRSYPFTYTVNAANTWETKVVNVPGDTTGTWATDNTGGIHVNFGLGVGTTYSGTAGSWAGANYLSATGAVALVNTNAATWYVTGVQLESGTFSTAPSFERRDYGRELMMCQRYYFKVQGTGTGNSVLGMGYCNVANTSAVITTTFPTTMRTRATALEQSGTAGDYALSYANTVATCTSVPAFSSATTESMALTVFTSTSAVVAQGAGARGSSVSGNSSAYLAWSAEL